MKVTVVKYNPKWIEYFEEESEKLQYQLGQAFNHIYHIGSTAVPGLMAKPIIDILLDVKDLEDLDRQVSKFEDLGYEAMVELGIPGRRYYRKGGDNRTHQIHAFKAGDSNLLRHIAFCEYLKAHLEVAHEYGELKLQIARNCNHDIENYSDGKDSFVKYHEALAIEWYSKSRQAHEQTK